MEFADTDYFVEVSLGSVLRKAVDLECALRSCKAKAEEGSCNNPRGGISVGGGEHFMQPNSIPQSSNRSTITADLPSLWQGVTSYIVSLEKEEQYYKQLVQDIQVKQVNNAGGCSRCQLPPAILGTAGVEDSERRFSGVHDGSLGCILLCVFSYLSVRELCRVSQVSHVWQSVARHPSLWRRLLLSETILPPQVFHGMARSCSSTETLILQGLMPPMATYDEDLQSYISKTRGSLEPAVKAIMEASQNSLHFLSFIECSLMITDRVFWLASIHCPSLQSLTYCSDEFPPNSHSLWALANGCRQLRHLTLPPVLGSPHAGYFNDSCLTIIGHAWPGLLSLTVGGSALTTLGLVDIARQCQMLENLEVIHGPCLHKEAMEQLCSEGGLSSLLRLVLNFTPTSHIALKLLIHNRPTLTSVELHVTFSSYFSETDTGSVANYTKIISNIKRLRNKCQDILHIYEH